MFDEKQAVITSGNLTNGGLLRNFEYGILTDEPDTLAKICCDFQSLWNDEKTGSVHQSDIDSVKDILNRLPKVETVKFPIFSVDADSPEQNFEVLEVTGNAIPSALSGWKLEVFNCIDQINSQNFNLNDIYSFESHLQQIYPTNQNIRDKIRQQLQYLRDLGLLEFLGNGRYKKLWK